MTNTESTTTETVNNTIEQGIKEYHGQCHCGEVKFSFQCDLTATKTGKCNCTICAKYRFWILRLPKVEDFKLLTSSENAATYKSYNFCKKCFTLTHSMGDYGEGPYCCLNVSCFDLTPAQRSALANTTQYYDGLHNNWWNPPEFTNYL